MNATKLSDRDRLMTRPAEKLPTPLEPQSPKARGYPVDPKCVPVKGQGDPDAMDPAPEAIERTA